MRVIVTFIASLLIGSTAVAQAPAESPFKFEMHGFVSVSAAYQTGTFGLSEGQLSLASTTPSPFEDNSSLSFDVRQSRIRFSLTGPAVLYGATPSAHTEIDWVQGYGGGQFGSVSLLPRLRVVYVQLDWGQHRLQLGQQNDLTFAMAPTSLSHIVYPLAYLTGSFGWRRPGIFGYHTFALPNEFKIEGAWEVGRSQWADAAALIGQGAPNNPAGISLGEASGLPAFEARLTLSRGTGFLLWAAGHVNQVDLTGVGNTSPSARATVTVSGYSAGVKYVLGLPNSMALTIQGSGFVGQNLYPLVVLEYVNFRVPPTGDVAMFGYWAQLGFNFTKEWSLWAFYGGQKFNEADFVRSGGGAGNRYQNATTNVLAMYRDGAFGLSAEWIGFNTTYATAVDTVNNAVTANRSAKSNQYMLTANYFF